MTWLSLAVIPSARRTQATEGELVRTSADAPQLVLKTVFLAFAAFRRHPPQIELPHQESADIRERPPRFAKLAVCLAVKYPAAFGRTVPNRGEDQTTRKPRARSLTSTDRSIAQLSRQLFDNTAGVAQVDFADSRADLVRPRPLRRLDRAQRLAAMGSEPDKL